MHAFAEAPNGIVPRVQWLRLTALFFLVFGLLLRAEEADAGLFRQTQFTDAGRAIARSEPALVATLMATLMATFTVSQDEVSPCAAQPVSPGGSLGDLFSRPGLLGGFAAGFLGAGVFGLLFGHGLIGELSGMPSFLGLLFQFALLVALGWLIWAWWRADKSAAVELSPRQLADAYGRERDPLLPKVDGEANRKRDADGKIPFGDEAKLPL